MAPIPVGTVTFLFTDIEGSTRLWEQFPTAMKAALETHDKLLRELVEAYGGHVFKMVGDGLCAAFQSAADALISAVRAQQAICSNDWAAVGLAADGIKVRMAIHTGSTEEH
ncbi:MAG TPA: adenylate/guanylate cyclase domain-containing protein, partial [Chloroflexia bacterium]|nr:adenylate/guanylate cyclase domain-containing protein [Chloroflexia bacterium]